MTVRLVTFLPKIPYTYLMYSKYTVLHNIYVCVFLAKPTHESCVCPSTSSVDCSKNHKYNCNNLYM